MRSDIKESKIIFHEFFKIERSRLSWEQFDGSMGHERIRYVIRRGDSVGVIAVCMKCDRVILVQQFRYPAVREGDDGYLWEVPAGMIDSGEEPRETAERELYEETGTDPQELRHLVSYYLSPGALDEKIHIYSALIPDCSNLKPIGGNKSEHENLRIKAFRKEELLEMIKNNTIRDGKSVAALLIYLCLC